MKPRTVILVMVQLATNAHIVLMHQMLYPSTNQFQVFMRVLEDSPDCYMRMYSYTDTCQCRKGTK